MLVAFHWARAASVVILVTAVSTPGWARSVATSGRSSVVVSRVLRPPSSVLWVMFEPLLSLLVILLHNLLTLLLILLQIQHL